MGGWVDGWTGGRVYRWMGGGARGWMGGWGDGWMDGLLYDSADAYVSTSVVFGTRVLFTMHLLGVNQVVN